MSQGSEPREDCSKLLRGLAWRKDEWGHGGVSSLILLHGENSRQHWPPRGQTCTIYSLYHVLVMGMYCIKL